MENIEKAATVLRGIDRRDPDLAVTHIDPDRYVDHSPAVPDGVGGLADFVRGLPEGQHHLTPVRAIGEGAYVVIHAWGDLHGDANFFDLFRFDDGVIVEHWGFSAPAGPPSRSGHTQTDGPTQPLGEENTEQNKALVRAYYEAVHIGGRHDVVPRYITENHARHDPGTADGGPAFLADLAVLTRNRTIDEIVHLVGQGDLVFIAARGTVDGLPCVYIDLYRVEGEHLVEHWGFPEQVPPPATWRNAHGML